MSIFGLDADKISPQIRRDSFFDHSLDNIVKKMPSDAKSEDKWMEYRHSMVSIDYEPATKSNVKNWTKYVWLKDPTFWTLGFALFLIDLTIFFPYRFLPTLMARNGIEESDCGTIIGIAAGISALDQILM